MTEKNLDKYCKENDYFRLRKITPESYKNYRFPRYLEKIVPSDKSTKILDIGCGFGQLLLKLRERGYVNSKGIDISKEACDCCKSQGIKAEKIKDIADYCKKTKEKYDLIIMSHVLEHIEKEEIVKTLIDIRKHLLTEKGKLCIIVPNAQSNTGCYWFFEDFTHKTLFTSGSLFYVLSAAGFKKIKFIDKRATEGFGFFVRLIRNTFFPLYYYNKFFWNRITSSGYHGPSPKIFTYEIKALAEKQ